MNANAVRRKPGILTISATSGSSGETMPPPVVDQVETPMDVTTPDADADDKLPVASPVEIKQEELQIPEIQYAVPQELVDDKKCCSTTQRNWWIAALVSLLVLLGVVLGVTMGTRSNGDTVPIEPTPSPTSQVFASLKSLITFVSPDGGAALEDTESPQFKALTWLEGNANLDAYEDWNLIQRYALATFYLSTGGEDWFKQQGWLSDSDECSWISIPSLIDEPACNDDGAIHSLTFVKNALKGTIPVELALLSDSLGEFPRNCDLAAASVDLECSTQPHVSFNIIDCSRSIY